MENKRIGQYLEQTWIWVNIRTKLFEQKCLVSVSNHHNARLWRRSYWKLQFWRTLLPLSSSWFFPDSEKSMSAWLSWNFWNHPYTHYVAWRQYYFSYSWSMSPMLVNGEGAECTTDAECESKLCRQTSHRCSDVYRIFINHTYYLSCSGGWVVCTLLKTLMYFVYSVGTINTSIHFSTLKSVTDLHIVDQILTI